MRSIPTVMIGILILGCRPEFSAVAADEPPNVAMCQKAISYLLDSREEGTAEIARLRRIVAALRAQGNNEIHLLIRPAGKPMNDISRKYSLVDNRATAISSKEMREAAYQFVVRLSPEGNSLWIKASNLDFHFRIDNSGESVTFESSKEEEISTPSRPSDRHIE